MKEQFEYGFWFWSNKLNGILSLLAEICDYELLEDERFTIKEVELVGTNDYLGKWGDYKLHGKQHLMELWLAYDEEEKEDMIHLRIRTSVELKEKLEMINLFQCMFRELVE